MVALARVESAVERAEPFLPAEKVQLLKDTLLKGATDLELQLFVTQCEKRRLDPFTRQFYGIKTGQGLQMFASIDGLRVIAQRSGEYRGQVGPFWCGTDGQWADVWLAQEPPAAAKVGVLREGWPEPLWGVATFKSYGAGKSSPVWRTMPDVMLAKAAEALALRKAFPDDMSGLYTPEEIEHEKPPDRQPAPVAYVGNPTTGTTVEGLETDDGIIDADVIDADTPHEESGRQAPSDARVDVATGRIDKPESVAAEIKAACDRLGWKKNDMLDEARKQGIDVRSFDGSRQMRDLLEVYVRGA